MTLKIQLLMQRSTRWISGGSFLTFGKKLQTHITQKTKHTNILHEKTLREGKIDGGKNEFLLCMGNYNRCSLLYVCLSCISKLHDVHIYRHRALNPSPLFNESIMVVAERNFEHSRMI